MPGSHHMLAIVMAAGALAAPALAQTSATTVIGRSPSRLCFEAVQSGGAGRRDIRLCDAALNAAQTSSRDRAVSFVNRGILKSRMGDHFGALTDYRSALDIDPELPEAYVNRAVALIYLEQYKEAVAALGKAIDYGASKLHQAYYNRSIAYEGMGDHEAAYRDAMKALEIAPDWPPAQYRVEECEAALRKRGDTVAPR